METYEKGADGKLAIEEVCAGEGLNNIKSQLQVRRWIVFYIPK